MKVIAVLLSCFLYLNGFSQADTQVSAIPQKSVMDTSYIADLSDYLNVYMFGVTKYNYFNITNKNTNQKLKYSPNDNFNVGFGFNYKWLGLGVAFNLPSVNNDNDKYGTTQSFDAQMNVFAHKYLVDVYLNHYQGYYIKNPEIMDTTFDKSGVYPTLPSMQSTNFGLSYFHVLNNNKFSYRASFIQNERQKKMAGSMILGFITHYNLTIADTAFVPYNFIQDIEDADNYLIKASSSFDIGPMFGYAYNFVIRKKFMITLSTVPGIVFQRIGILATVNGQDELVFRNKLGYVISNKIALVFNGDNFYWGINYNDFHSTHEYERVTLSSSVGNFRLFFGRRFNIKKKN